MKESQIPTLSTTPPSITCAKQSIATANANRMEMAAEEFIIVVVVVVVFLPDVLVVQLRGCSAIGRINS